MTTETKNTQGWYGLFYYAKNDNRVWVRKRWGYGWTFNFARPMTYVILGVLLGAPLLVFLFIR